MRLRESEKEFWKDTKEYVFLIQKNTQNKPSLIVSNRCKIGKIRYSKTKHILNNIDWMLTTSSHMFV